MATVDWSGYNQLLAKVTVTSSPKYALFVQPTPGTKSWSLCSAPTIAKTASNPGQFSSQILRCQR
jgi:hypothetical protein